MEIIIIEKKILYIRQIKYKRKIRIGNNLIDNLNNTNKIKNYNYSNTETQNEALIKNLKKKYIINSNKSKIQTNNSKTEENTILQTDPIKKLKYIFQIDVGDKMKKLIIYDGDNRNKKVEDFCDINKLGDFEKEQIINMIERKIRKNNY